MSEGNGLPEGWDTAPLDQVTLILDSYRVPVNAKERALRQGDFPYYGANGQAGTIDDYLLDGDFVLVAEDGGHFDEPSRGVAYPVSGKIWVNNHAHILGTLGGMSSAFLTHRLNTIDWMKCIDWVG